MSESMKDVLEEENKIREILLNSMEKISEHIKLSQETFENMNIYIASDNELCGEYKDSGAEMSITFKHDNPLFVFSVSNKEFCSEDND